MITELEEDMESTVEYYRQPDDFYFYNFEFFNDILNSNRRSERAHCMHDVVTIASACGVADQSEAMVNFKQMIILHLKTLERNLLHVSLIPVLTRLFPALQRLRSTMPALETLVMNEINEFREFIKDMLVFASCLHYACGRLLQE